MLSPNPIATSAYRSYTPYIQPFRAESLQFQMPQPPLKKLNAYQEHILYHNHNQDKAKSALKSAAYLGSGTLLSFAVGGVLGVYKKSALLEGSGIAVMLIPIGFAVNEIIKIVFPITYDIEKEKYSLTHSNNSIRQP